MVLDMVLAIKGFYFNFDLALDNFVFGTFLSVIYLILSIKLLDFLLVKFLESIILFISALLRVCEVSTKPLLLLVL